MSTSKKTLNNARALKKLGLISYDLRKPLTKSQKSTINKRAQKFSDIIKNPNSYFKLKSEKLSTARKASQSDLVTYKNNIFLPKRGANRAKIIDDRIYTVTTNKKTGESKREELFLIYRKNILQQIDYFEKHPLPDGDYLMIRIGSNSPFGSFLTPQKLLDYLNNWQTDDLKNMDRKRYKGIRTREQLLLERNDLISQMYIVSHQIPKPKNLKHLLK